VTGENTEKFQNITQCYFSRRKHLGRKVLMGRYKKGASVVMPLTHQCSIY